MCLRSMAGVPFDSVGRFRASLLLRTTSMRPQRLGAVSCVVALQTNKQTNKQVEENKGWGLWTSLASNGHSQTATLLSATIGVQSISGAQACGTQVLRDAIPACLLPCLLLPPAAAACYIYCRRLLCANQARGRSGLEAILGREPEQSVCGRPGRSLESEVTSFHTGKNPSESRQKVRRGVTPTIFVLLNFLGLHLLFGWNLRGQTHTHYCFWRLHRQCWPPTSRRIQPSPPTNLHCICEHFCDPP